MRRIVTVAAVIGVLISLSVVQAIAGKNFKPIGFLSKAELEEFCDERGGDFIDAGHGTYACVSPDGQVVICWDTVCFQDRRSRAQAPARLTDAILSDQLADQQRILLANLGQLLAGLGNVGNKLDDLQAACAPPDLVPVAAPGSSPPEFCQTVEGDLVVRVKNQGLTGAAASTLRVTFNTPSGPVPVDVSTPALAGGGGFVDLAIPIPADCFLPAAPFPSPCNFQIAVDVADVVVESTEANNNASGVCVPVI